MTQEKSKKQLIKSLMTKMTGPKGHLVKRPDSMSHDEWSREIIKAFGIPRDFTNKA